MRVAAKTDYALRAMAQLAADADGAVPAARLSEQQDIPLKFLQVVLTELRRARLVRSTRGTDGGYALYRPAGEITLADVVRAVDGPLVDVHGERLRDLEYPGAASRLTDVWMAARTALRTVFEHTTVADLAAGDLPPAVWRMAQAYRDDTRHEPTDPPLHPR